MAVPYHTHEFLVPTATLAEAEARSRSDVLVSPASLPPAATLAQGLKADTAIQPETLPSVSFTPTGGAETTVQTALDKAESAIQLAQLPLLMSRSLKADGVTDDTLALNALFVAATAKNCGVQLPAGNIIYNGEGWDTEYPYIVGAGRGSTVIVMGASSRLIKSNRAWGGLVLRGITTVGGLGAIKNDYANANVAGKFIVEGNFFKDYSSACIESNAIDMPYWAIRDNVFQGANYSSTMGAALRGWTDGCVLSGNEFLANAVHLKLGRGGQNAYINENDFIRVGPGTGRIDVWVVPVPISENLVSGQGLTLRDCKFGSENLDPTDMAIVYADEGSGSSFGVRMPAFSLSSGVISGHKVTDCAIFGNTSSPTRSLVYSFVPDLRGCEYSYIRVGGTPPRMLLEFSQELSPAIYNQNSIVGPALFGDQQAALYQDFRLTNGFGIGRLDDVTGVSSRTDYDGTLPVHSRSTSGFGDFRELITGTFTAGGYVGCTGAGISDAYGGGDATEITTTTAGGYLAVPLSPLPAKGRPVWLELDAARSASSAVDFSFIRIRNLTTNSIEFVEYFKLPPNALEWREIRLFWAPRASPAGGYRVELGAQSLGKFRTSRLKIYQSRQPLGGGIIRDISFIPNSSSIPTANPSGGGILYVQSGALKYRGPSGTVTTLGSS